MVKMLGKEYSSPQSNVTSTMVENRGFTLRQDSVMDINPHGVDSSLPRDINAAMWNGATGATKATCQQNSGLGLQGLLAMSVDDVCRLDPPLQPDATAVWDGATEATE